MSTASDRLARSVSSLSALSPGSAAWFWMIGEGPEGQPFFVLVDQDDDRDGQKFCRRVAWVVRELSEPGAMVKGVIRRLASGRLTLATADGLELAGSLYTRLCLIVDMPDVLMLSMGASGVIDSRLVENLAAADDTVAGLAAGERAWFCLVDAAPAARLVLDRSQEGIRQRLGEQVTGQSAIRGQIQRIRSGDLRIVVREDAAPRLRRALVRWGATEAAGWPALRALSTSPIHTR